MKSTPAGKDLKCKGPETEAGLTSYKHHREPVWQGRTVREENREDKDSKVPGKQIM